MSFSLIGQQNGFSVDVGASQSRSKGNGSSLVNHNSQIHADETLKVSSGRDTALAGALASGASPLLATEIKKQTTNPLTGKVDVATNAMAHAVLGAVTAQLNNQSALAGGVGGGELAARFIAGQMFPDKTMEQLNESEKQQVSALSQLAAGIAGGLASDSSAGTVTAAQAGKNAVENNNLASRELGACKTLSANACGKAKDLSQRILDKGLPSAEDIRDRLNACKDDGCKKDIWTEYRQANGKTIATLKERALRDELSREELAFISHDLARELAFKGRQADDKVGMSEYMTWLNGGAGPLSGFFNTELREKELIAKGFTPKNAVQQVKEEKRDLMVADAAIGAIAAKVTNKGNTVFVGVEKHKLPMIKLSLLIKIITLNRPSMSRTYKLRVIRLP